MSPLSPSHILQLQRTIGNRAVAQLMKSDKPAPSPSQTAIQRYVTVDEAGEDHVSMQDAMSNVTNLNGKEKSKLALWVKDTEDKGRYATWGELETAIKVKEAQIDPKTLPDPKFTEMKKVLFMHASRHAENLENTETMYRAMCKAELEQFVENGGLTSRLNNKGNETGQQFVSDNLEYSKKLAFADWKEGFAKKDAQMMDSYKYMVELHYVRGTMGELIGSDDVRVGSGDNKSQELYPDVKHQAKDEHGVAIVKSEPLKGGGRATNIGFQPRTRDKDTRSATNSKLVYAVLVGQIDGAQ
ncbi:hypothetical protein BC351_26065 [Paenibacillus ferrarius]|uniref:Uncharacterized protein n=2 Tax=Paenibacillus ferrarius TaxID=1469647 RepID=A0A1V4HIR5_9BACL|nr:hypothetical protein BC351_26065 [Paenibacillus ferrarius]